MTKKLAIVLAAGRGTRMQSELPKVLIPVRGRPMIEYVLDALDRCGIDESLVVIGYRGEDVRKALRGRPRLAFVEQTEQRGTGHAAMVCRERLEGHDGAVLIVTGDSPLVQTASLARLLADFDSRRPACILGTAHKDNPAGLGRIVRDAAGAFAGIVEEKDATPAERRITEVNLSCYVFDCRALLFALSRIGSNNRQNEYYLTDCPGVLQAAGHDVRALPILEPCETLSINTPEELAVVEAAMADLHYPQARSAHVP